MAEKLKSILKQTHWSLVIKAVVFGVAWFFLPFWLFLLVALYLYFVPFFQSHRLFWPFFALLILTFVEPANFLFLIVFAGLFYYLLLIKDLLLIDRRFAHELLVLVLSFLLVHDFYERFRWVIGGTALAYSLLLAILVVLMAKGFMEKANRLLLWLFFVLAWQFIVLGLFIPIDFIYQSLIVFIALFTLIDIISSYAFGSISRHKILATSLSASILLVIVLASASWKA
jgi:hypothetical protein